MQQRVTIIESISTCITLRIAFKAIASNNLIIILEILFQYTYEATYLNNIRTKYTRI